MYKPNSSSQNEPLDWKMAIEYLGGDVETATSLLEKADSACFDELLPKIFGSIQAKDWRNVSTKTALLRGSCSYMATFELVKSCTKLETLCSQFAGSQKELAIERAREEHLIAQTYFDLLHEVRRVKTKIAEITNKPANYTIVDEQEVLLNSMISITSRNNCVSEEQD